MGFSAWEHPGPGAGHDPTPARHSFPAKERLSNGSVRHLETLKPKEPFQAERKGRGRGERSGRRGRSASRTEPPDTKQNRGKGKLAGIRGALIARHPCSWPLCVHRLQLVFVWVLAACSGAGRGGHLTSCQGWEWRQKQAEAAAGEGSRMHAAQLPREGKVRRRRRPGRCIA